MKHGRRTCHYIHLVQDVLSLPRKLVQPLWKTLCMFLQKLETELPGDSAMPLLGISLKEVKSPFQRDRCTPTPYAALFTIAMT